MPFCDDKLRFLRFFFNFSIEAEKLIFLTKCCFFTKKSMQNSLLIKLVYFFLSIFEISEIPFFGIS